MGSCLCHGKSLLNVNTVTAYDQCWHCCKKHFITAWTLWNEFNYQTINLSAIEGNLRLSIMHIQYTNEEIAKKIRELSLDIEKRDLTKVTEERWESLINAIQESIYKEFPDLKQKYDDFLKK